jgi:hypothetical protein
MKRPYCTQATIALLMLAPLASQAQDGQPLGREVAIPRHLQDGEEFQESLPDLIRYGKELFLANWTSQEGGGRPLTKGNGNPLSDRSAALAFPRNFNRISGPDANSCAGCHNAPFGIPGGGGDFVANVFVLGQRFDFATFDNLDAAAMRGSRDEMGRLATAESIGNSRATIGMFGSGYIEMLARQMTAELQVIRDRLQPGESCRLVTKGVSFGELSRRSDGSWNVSRIQGLPAPSMDTRGPGDPPKLIIKPFHQAGAIQSLRMFTINAFNQHLGMQATERFGIGADPDNDGVVNELTRADITASVIYQASMAVPGRVIPNDSKVEQAVWEGEQAFEKIGCALCHIPSLPLDRDGWIYSEPNPYNEPGNLRPGEAPVFKMDLNDKRLPQPRLTAERGVTYVPAYTDLKLHDICSGPDDPNGEALDMNAPPGSPAFFAGNRLFITKKLWGSANEPPFFHHGKFTTLREAVLAHSGEAAPARKKFELLEAGGQASVIEFLKTLRVLPPGTQHLIVDERGKPKAWPPRRISAVLER